MLFSLNVIYSSIGHETSFPARGKFIFRINFFVFFNAAFRHFLFCWSFQCFLHEVLLRLSDLQLENTRAQFRIWRVSIRIKLRVNQAVQYGLGLGFKVRIREWDCMKIIRLFSHSINIKDSKTVVPKALKKLSKMVRVFNFFNYKYIVEI